MRYKTQRGWFIYINARTKRVHSGANLAPSCIYGVYVVDYTTLAIYTENPDPAFRARYSLSLQILLRFQACRQMSPSYPSCFDSLCAYSTSGSSWACKQVLSTLKLHVDLGNSLTDCNLHFNFIYCTSCDTAQFFGCLIRIGSQLSPLHTHFYSLNVTVL